MHGDRSRRQYAVNVIHNGGGRVDPTANATGEREAMTGRTRGPLR
jgi:hypothetical protein